MNQPTTIDLLGRLDAVIFEADPRTLQVTSAAGGALRRLGFSAGELVGDAQLLIKRLHPDDREEFLSLLRAVAADGKERQLEHRMISAGGEERWFRSELHCPPGHHQLLGLMIDATDARRSAEALRAAESRLRQVINRAPIVIMALDAKGNFTLAEGSGLRGLELEPSRVVGHNIFEGWKSETDILAHVRRALAGEAFTAYDRVHALGSWWETRWAPLYDADKRVSGATGVALDISDRKRAEDASQQSMSLLRATLDATTDGILVVDNGGRIIDFNRRFAEMWNVPADVMAPRDDAQVLAVVVAQVRDPDAFLAKVRLLYAEPTSVSHDVIEFRDGRIYERDSRPQVVDGVTVGRVWSFRDVSVERRATRRATFLAAASKILAGPLEDVTPLDVIARLTVPWLCDWCNILLLDDNGAVGSAAAYHHDATKIDAVRRLRPDMRLRDRGVARALTTGEPVVYNGITVESLSGQPDSISLSAREQLEIVRSLGLRGYMVVPLVARGQIIGAITFATADERRRFDNDELTLATDLAQRAALAIDNQRLYQSSKQAVALRDEFLSVASHELRTPVTSLQLAVQSALSVGSDAPAGFLRHALESAERQARRLSRLVDALLDVSRIQAGRLELHREPIDLVVLVRDVVSMLAEDARRAGCDVVVDAPRAAGGVIGEWDRARLDQVMTNLLSNAIKYGAGAPISIAITVDGDRARLAVRDRGIGVAAEERERIFERFERAVSSQHYGGLGLGLYIVRRIVDAHGGGVAVESAPGGGATFVVELPLRSASI
ncbi:MAG: hypothetical protein JWM53_5140 [bacterium]|nr:hypothetical protein [bacterium]